MCPGRHHALYENKRQKTTCLGRQCVLRDGMHGKTKFPIQKSWTRRLSEQVNRDPYGKLGRGATFHYEI